MNTKLPLKTKVLNSVRRMYASPGAERILLGLVRGSEFSGLRTRFIPGPELYDFGSVRKITRDGINFSLDLSCRMQWNVFWKLKEKQRDRLYSLVSKGDVVLDVGTNIGETLLHFAKYVGEGGYVYGFEPDRLNIKNAQKNVALNSFTNIHIFNVGVSDARATARLFRVNPHNLGMNRMLNEVEAADFDDYDVIQTDTLDNIVSENNFDRVDLVKIDIEGYEMHALKGAKAFLKEFRPKLFIEVGYERLLNLGTSPTELIGLLTDIGYSVFHSETDEPIGVDFDFSPVADGSIDVYAVLE